MKSAFAATLLQINGISVDAERWLPKGGMEAKEW
jgi:hypothetical protein